MLNEETDRRWPGTPSTSSLWYLTADVYGFIARRGVSCLVPSGVQDSTEGDEREDAVQRACASLLRAARELDGELHKQAADIAAEANHCGIPYSVIAHALSISRSRPQQIASKASWQPTDVSCLSQEWLAGANEPGVQIARHLINQASEVTPVEIPATIVDPPEDWIRFLVYLVCTGEIRGALERTIAEIVAEMRAEGGTWRAVGEALGRGESSTQRSYRDGISAERLTELHWEREAATMLVTEPPEGFGDDAEGMSPAIALHYAINRLRKAVDGAVAYATRLQEWVKHHDEASNMQDDGLIWAHEASQHIREATKAVMAPGVMLATLKAGRLMDDIFERFHKKSGASYGSFVLYLFFLFALTAAYSTQKFVIFKNVEREGRQLTANEVEESFMSIGKATSIAKILVETSERLYLDQIFKFFSDGSYQPPDDEEIDDDTD